MADIHPMPGRGPLAGAIDAPPVADVIERLEQLLKLARAGHVRALAYAIVDARNNTFDGWVAAENEPSGHALIASVGYLHGIVAQKTADLDATLPVIPE